MKIIKIRAWNYPKGYNCNTLDANISRCVLGREVGFDPIDFNRIRKDRKNCIIDYKLMKWEYRE